jgi:ferritin-like metal-binding protein YciE
MSRSDQKIVQYLNEAHASEVGLVSVLKSQIAMTPRGSYRAGLEKHLAETRTHARRIQERLGDLDQARNPLQAFLGFTESLVSQTLALSKTPFDLLRGSGGEEKVLKNAKDACATESLEIATYTALERLANNVGDEQTANLAASIRGDEERMLERVMREIPKLTDAVVGAEIEGKPSYDITTTGAADATRGVAGEVTHTARKTQTRAKRTARQARKVPGVAQAEGQIKGAVASEEDLSIARYDSLTAEEIVTKLPELSQIDLAKVDSYERKNDNRTTVLSRITALRRAEPWPGYDELTVAEIEAVLGEGDHQRAKDVVAYERAHKNRAGVLKSAERETANA